MKTVVQGVQTQWNSLWISDTPTIVIDINEFYCINSFIYISIVDRCVIKDVIE
jgi:hypothetical protein